MPKELIPFDESEKLIVGKTYNVKAVLTKGENYDDTFRRVYIPVVGVFHNDKTDFDFGHKHYHIDGRFTNQIVNEEGKTFQIVLESEIHVIRRKCKRLTTGLPIDSVFNCYTPESKSLAQFRRFFKKYLGQSCAGRKCPHYGAHMPYVNGRLECPLHGLVGDIETEVIINRSEFFTEQAGLTSESFLEYLDK